MHISLDGGGGGGGRGRWGFGLCFPSSGDLGREGKGGMSSAKNDRPS